MTTATPTLMTADEFLQQHGHERGVELVDGQLVRLPMPGFEHGEICFNVAMTIGGYVKAHKLGRVCTNDSFVRIRPDAVRGPDVLFVSYRTLPADQPRPHGAINPPLELVVEVRSPSDRLDEVFQKAQEYLAAGVVVALVFDPETESATVFRTGEIPQRYHNGDNLTLPDVLPGFAVPVRQFFE